ncbi:MAG TPA: DUF1697 domain-containing protein [Chthoniobacterales bacterium]
MPRYVAFLRGVSPSNLKMSDLKSCLESAGFTNVRTILSSGNAAFDSSSRSPAAIEPQIEAAMTKQLGRTFYTIVRSRDALQEMIDADPFARFEFPAAAKRVVTFARKLPPLTQSLPVERDGAIILAAGDREAFSAYVAGPRGPVFMELIKATFGSDVTTRTWETVRKCAQA